MGIVIFSNIRRPIKVKGKVLSLIVSLVFFFSATGVSTATAHEGHNNVQKPTIDKQVEPSNAKYHNKDSAHKREWIKLKAKELGIITEGKTDKELRKAVHRALIHKKAKELGISTDGKSTKELAKEVREKHIKNEAKKLGISTEGKDLRELKKQVIDKKVRQKAEELGIKTEGRELHEIIKEVKEKHPEEAKRFYHYKHKKMHHNHAKEEQSQR